MASNSKLEKKLGLRPGSLSRKITREEMNSGDFPITKAAYAIGDRINRSKIGTKANALLEKKRKLLDKYFK